MSEGEIIVYLFTKIKYLPFKGQQVDGGIIFEELLCAVVLHVSPHVVAVQHGPGVPSLFSPRRS